MTRQQFDATHKVFMRVMNITTAVLAVGLTALVVLA